MVKNIFIVAGDLSGDIHASNLVNSIKRIHPETFVTSIGGINLRESSDRFLYDLINLSSFGFSGPIKQFLKLRKLFKINIEDEWNIRRPDSVIVVDYYGFNIHVAKLAHTLGIPVFYYISPQIWATRAWRIKKITKYVTKMLVILPFEEALYRNAGVDVSFVGHPLIDSIPMPLDHPVDLAKPIIGLFPGSRKNVFRRHIPILQETAKLIKHKIGAEFRIVAHQGMIEECAELGFPLVRANDFKERQKITLAITTSGTVSLENALLGIPMVVFYRLSGFNYWLARKLIKIPYITLVNILAGESIVPELIQDCAKPEIIADKVIQILSDKMYYNKLCNQLASFRENLGIKGVSDRAADIIMNS